MPLRLALPLLLFPHPAPAATPDLAPALDAAHASDPDPAADPAPALAPAAVPASAPAGLLPLAAAPSLGGVAYLGRIAMA